MTKQYQPRNLTKRLRLIRRKAIIACEKYRSNNIDGNIIQTVCVMLGPYRNLSTLTASLLALHPSCQVLNHAGKRIFVDSDLDFLRHYDDQTFDNFVRYALQISTSGRSGTHGGSITLSHAFKYPKMKQAYQSRFSDSLDKPDATCLVWKESLAAAKRMRRYNFNLDRVFETNDRLRFLMPVRHPLDCAASNQKSVNHLQIFETLDENPTGEEVLAAILDELVWFLALHRQYPDRFFYYFQNRFNEDTIKSLATFLKLAPDEQWVQAVQDCYDIKSSYQHPASLVAFYKQQVHEKFADCPDVKAALLAFVD